MNKILLYLVMMPFRLWQSMGADVAQLRAILDVRLTLDDRNPMAIGRMKPKKDRKYGSILNLLTSLVLGFMYIFPLIVVKDRVFSMAIYFTLLMTVIIFMLITDFSNVLFDSRDKYILFPRPVNDQTLVLARLLHVFIYLLRIILPMALPAWVMLGYVDGWKSALLFTLPLVLMVFMVLFIVNSIYLVVLRLARPEKFKDIINYFQVVTSVIFFASVYMMPRFFDPERPPDFNILSARWIRYAPSYWFGVCWSWIGCPVNLPGTSLLSVLAIIVPLCCMYVLVRWLAPRFSQRISGIDAVDTEAYRPQGTTRKAPGKFYQKIAYAFNRNDDARAGFAIAWLQTSRSRSFKMRVYPTFAFVPIYFFYNLTLGKHSFSYTYEHLKEGSRYLFLLYTSSFVMISALTYLTMSDQYKAAWIYYATPVEKPGKIMIGAFKALWVKYFLPFFIFLSVFVLYIWGAPAIWDIVLAMVNVTLFVSCMARISYRHLPFSLKEQAKQSGNRLLKSFLVMIIPASLGFGHYFAMNLLWLKLIFLALSSILLWLVWDSYANTTWEQMIKTESE
jgi:ABC-2 type transport system permease protein